VLSHEWFCERAGAEIEALAAVVGGAPDIAVRVPACPGWTVADLAGHTGNVHRWATAIVTARAAERPPFPELESPWSSADGWARWLTSGAVPLLAALRSAGPAARVWTWGADGTSGWWARRIVHETAVHRADAQLALGIEPDIDPVTAADGIEEFLENLPAARRPSRHLAELPAGASLHLHATDCDGEWVVRFGADGPRAEGPRAEGPRGEGPRGEGPRGEGPRGERQSTVTWTRGHEKATAAVRGPVADLLLFTYGRYPAAGPRLSVFGDTSLLDLWQEKLTL
jgi:uncharacterized protein (TIGR03083 family)